VEELLLLREVEPQHRVQPVEDAPEVGRAVRRRPLGSGLVDQAVEYAGEVEDLLVRAAHRRERVVAGERAPPAGDVERRLADAVNETVTAGGNLVIPAFAVGRAQDVLFRLNRLVRAARVPRLLTFVDSPMATSVTQLYRRHTDDLAPALAEAFGRGESPFDAPGLTFVRAVEQSKALNQLRGSAVISAGAGMCNGGRIKHHLVANIERAESTVLFVGYQARGTLGRQIVDGVDPVRILGEPRAVRARIERIEEFSAHGDREALVAWVRDAPARPRRAHVVHGEPGAAEALVGALAEIGVDAEAAR